MTNKALHIVFGASPAGIVRRALSQLGRQEKVLDLMDDLSLGPIGSDDSEIRAKWFDEELSEFDWRGIASPDVALPEKSIGHNGYLIAWFAPNWAESYAGFMWWLASIGRVPVSIMPVPDLHFCNTDAMVNLVGHEIKLLVKDRNRYLARWQRLKSENAPLRIVQNGTLASAPLDYFDNLIIEYVSNEWRQVSSVVGDAFSQIGVKTGHFIGDVFTRSRLRALYRSGIIEWDGNTRDLRGSHVRRAKA